ncbi:MAG: MBL fold metallo-hydrolase [Anaerolineae bacterium]|nr:MBL fold metallo-hydrolase [Anaerolineae bacterium]
MPDFTLKRITEHVYWLPPDSRTDRPALAAVAGQGGTLMLDAGASSAHADLFLTELQRLGLAAPRLVGLTHWHWDHIFGAERVGAPQIAHRLTAMEIRTQARYDWSDAALDQRVADGLEIDFCSTMLKAEMPDPALRHIRLPEIVYEGALTIELGDVSCRIEHIGGDHAVDSSVMIVPEDKVVFLSDCVYLCLYADPPYYTTAKLYPLLDRLLAFDAEYYIEGHNEKVMSRVEFEEYAGFLRTIGDTVARMEGDHAASLAALLAALPDEEEAGLSEYVDAFIAGR